MALSDGLCISIIAWIATLQYFNKISGMVWCQQAMTLWFLFFGDSFRQRFSAGKTESPLWIFRMLGLLERDATNEVANYRHLLLIVEKQVPGCNAGVQ
jgi:hypothetical protein